MRLLSLHSCVILQDGTVRFFAVNARASSRKGENHAEGESVTIRAAPSTTGPGSRTGSSRFPRVPQPLLQGRSRTLSESHMGRGRLKEQGQSTELRGWGFHYPNGPGRWDVKSEGYSPDLQAVRFASLCFGFMWDPSPFLLYYFSLLEWECLSYACPTIVFWKHITCLFLQGHNWWGTLLRMNRVSSLPLMWFS